MAYWDISENKRFTVTQTKEGKAPNKTVIFTKKDI